MSNETAVKYGLTGIFKDASDNLQELADIRLAELQGVARKYGKWNQEELTKIQVEIGSLEVLARCCLAVKLAIESDFTIGDAIYRRIIEVPLRQETERAGLKVLADNRP